MAATSDRISDAPLSHPAEPYGRAYYRSTGSDLATADPVMILGHFASQLPFALDTAQRLAWETEITQLRDRIAPEFPDAEFFFEFAIPRCGRRADVVLLWNGVVFVVEYKVGAKEFQRHALDQAVGYALDLKNFHETSHNLPIVPVLIATEAEHAPIIAPEWSADGVAEPVRATPEMLSAVLRACASSAAHVPINADIWAAGRYKPTPTIIEAAQALYRGHSVAEISRNEAGAENLSVTAAYIDAVIDSAKHDHRKAICFVTGVPGSGKTLAGLNIANRRMSGHDDEHASFLSGNGPLVDVLREALTQDALTRARSSGNRSTHTAEYAKASAFIRNIHHFRDDALATTGPLVGKVIVFDEAQRAWNADQASKFMRQKRNCHDFSQSEPEFLLSVMDRNQDWCVVVCIVGGGQEINTGEAGISAWLDALSNAYSSWDIHFASQLLGREYLHTQLERHPAVQRAHRSPALHLSVSVRSYRAERLSEFVSAALDGHPDRARGILPELRDYPLEIVRDLRSAREWLRKRRRGIDRVGLLASSNALRLKPDGVFVRAKIDPVAWILQPNGDVRGSNALEDVATEFDVQGLELDWACLCWDANLRYHNGQWETWRFSGSRWQKVRDDARRAFLINSYRVLMTRARQGMVLFVPRGDTRDPTRPSSVYQDIADYLTSCGVPVAH